MEGASEPPLSELLWTVAMARLILGPAMSIQARRRMHSSLLPDRVRGVHGLIDITGTALVDK